MHEKDKERRLLNLKIKELQRIIPQNKLNPISRDKSAGPNRKATKKMKNSTISDANKSVIVTKKETRMKKRFGRDIDNNPSTKRTKDREDTRESLLKETISDHEQDQMKIDDKQRADSSLSKLKEKSPSEDDMDDEEDEIGRGLNGEPILKKREKDLEEVNPPKKLNPDTFMTEAEIKE